MSSHQQQKSKSKSKSKSKQQQHKHKRKDKVPHKSTKAKNTKTKRLKEIVFDPDARREYLLGFSERKRQRRAFGLAMQKVKDRKAKLENRKELKQAELERLEEAERLKQQVQEAAWEARHGVESDNDDEEEDDDNNTADKPHDQIDHQPKEKTTTTYHDQATQQQWGGNVVVTTALAPDLDSDNDEQQQKQKEPKSKPKRHRDEAQEYAGKVEKYLTIVKSNLPGKSKRQKTGAPSNQKRGGKHGAAGMKGIGSAQDIKVAQKVLARSKGGTKGSGKKGKKGKR